MKLKSYLLVSNSNYLVEINRKGKVVLSDRKLDGLELNKHQAELFRNMLRTNYGLNFEIYCYE